MATTTIDVRELPTRFAEMFALAAAGSEGIVTEGDVLRARLVPLVSSRQRVPGLHEGSMTTTEDFDAPLW